MQTKLALPKHIVWCVSFLTTDFNCPRFHEGTCSPIIKTLDAQTNLTTFFRPQMHIRTLYLTMLYLNAHKPSSVGEKHFEPSIDAHVIHVLTRITRRSDCKFTWEVKYRSVLTGNNTSTPHHLPKAKPSILPLILCYRID